jgi:hypothetical protein
MSKIGRDVLSLIAFGEYREELFVADSELCEVNNKFRQFTATIQYAIIYS